MRVVLASHVARASGAEIVLARLAVALAPSDEVHVVFLEDGPLADTLRADGVTVHIVGAAEGVVDVSREAGAARAAALAIGAARTVRSIRHLLGELRPDVVHAHSMVSGLLFGAAARSLRIPFLWHVHDRLEPDYMGRTSLGVARMALRVLPDGVATNSETASRTFRSRGPRAVLPNPVALLAEPREAPLSVHTFAVVGRITRWKGQDVAIRALAEAFPDGAESLVIVGDALFGEDAFGVELRELVAALGLRDRVRFSGHVEDVAGALTEVDVLIHASTLPEPFGLVIFEALRMGIPVIAADAGAPAEHLRDGGTALLVRPGDVRALAQAMMRMRDEPELRERLVRDGRAVGDRFAPEHAADAARRLYYQLIGRARP